MRKEDLSEENYVKILECFMQSVTKLGLKSTTMDSIAATLQMSKRTLYEIFGTKEDLFREAYLFFNKKMGETVIQIFNSSTNIMEAIVRCFLYNRDIMSIVSVDFIRDIQDFAVKENLINDSQRRQHHQHLLGVLQKGVDEGFFRNEVNLGVQCRMLTLQMEALKRSEELFPSDISLLEIYDNIITGFLRGISTMRGIQELEKYLPAKSPVSNTFLSKEKLSQN